MKKIRTIGKATLSLLLCCAMLSCTAFASGQVEVYHLGDVTITFGSEPPAIEPLADEIILLGKDNYTFSSFQEFSVNTKPEDGSDLSLRIDNYGNTNIKVLYTIKVEGEQELKLKREISPFANVYGTATSKAGGLKCAVNIEIEPANAGETCTASICVKQW